MDCSTVTWRQKVPQVLEAFGLQPDGDAYEFGVFEGESMRELRGLFPESRLWGFDSFAGLPAENEEEVLQVDFRPGHYAAKIQPEDMVNTLGGPEKAGFVVGFFDRTLKPGLRERRGMRQAFFIGIDADLYSSSFQALDWAFKSGLARPGTLIGYDDFWTNPCSKGGESLNPLFIGEGRAHREIAEKYRVRFSCVAGSCRFLASEARCASSWGVIFLVEAVNNVTLCRGCPRTPTHGFEMTDEQVRTWKQMNRHCIFHRYSPYHWLYHVD